MNRNEIHDTVSRTYADALKRSEEKRGGGCCGPASGCGSPAYGAEAGSYDDAAASSFGCGNPLAFAEVAADETVLDLGSGAGLDLLIAADKVGPGGRVIGVDMTDAMLDAARRNVERAGHRNVELRKGIIEELPVADASVDWVISNCVINLSPDKPRVFREIARVLRPGGRFSISDIVVEDLPAWIRGSVDAYTACVAGAVSEAEYVQGLRDAGLAGIETEEQAAYDAETLRAIAGDQLQVDVTDVAEAIEGKVRSVRFTGRKPL